jgi:hypothetical protein
MSKNRLRQLYDADHRFADIADQRGRAGSGETDAFSLIRTPEEQKIWEFNRRSLRAPDYPVKRNA